MIKLLFCTCSTSVVFCVEVCIYNLVRWSGTLTNCNVHVTPNTLYISVTPEVCCSTSGSDSGLSLYCRMSPYVMFRVGGS